MLYIGYPVSFETACKILNEPYVVRFEKINNIIETRLAEYGLNLYYYDKNVCILGVVVKELMIKSDYNYMQINDAFEIIKYYKEKVISSLKNMNADLSEFDIEIIEEEPKRVHNPEPYVLT